MVSRMPETATARWPLEPARLAAGERPAHAETAEERLREEVAHEGVLIALAQGLEDLGEDVPDRDGPVEVGLGQGGRAVDRDHLGRAGRDVDDADLLGRDPERLGQDGPQDLGRDLPRRLDRQDLAAERRIASLDDPDDDRAGRGDVGPGPGMVVEVLVGRRAVELADRAEIVDLVEADAAQRGEDLGGQDGGAELAVEHRRGDGDLVVEGLQRGERRRVGVDGVVGADPETLGAVDAELVDDAGLAVLDPDGPGRAGGHAVDAADALVLGDVDGVEVPVAHGVTCPFVLMVMSRRVPRPTSESMAKTSAFRLMFGRPMPAPNPSSRISAVAVE